MTSNERLESVAGISASLQAALIEHAGVDENGESVQIAGYAAAVVYVRPDGTSGLTVFAPYEEASTVADLLDRAGELVTTSAAPGGTE